jgi:hypothetical protein
MRKKIFIFFFAYDYLVNKMTESIENYDEILLSYNKAYEMRKYSHTTSNFHQKPEKIAKKMSLQSKLHPFFEIFFFRA